MPNTLTTPEVNERRPSNASNVSVKLNDKELDLTPRDFKDAEEGTVDVSEKNTFLEVDNNKGYKTLSIFRCYTSPVYRRLVSGVSSSQLGETSQDLGTLDTLPEDNSPCVTDNEKTLGPQNTVELEQKKAEKLTKQRQSLKQHAAAKEKKRQSNFKPDIKPFGRFEGYDMKALNTGRRGSIEPPAPLEKSHLELPTKRNSMEDDDFKSACASPAAYDNTPLPLPKNEDSKGNDI